MSGVTQTHVDLMFQSAPNPKVGRYLIFTQVRSPIFGVSIRSQPEGREIRARMAFKKSYIRVSIRSQPEGREIRCCTWSIFQITGGFNPLPTRRSGDTPLVVMGLRLGFVFQSAPNPKVGRYLNATAAYRKAYPFQSAPNPKVGRYYLFCK